MSLEQCAARMERFLARPARKAVTRVYLNSLPSRPVPKVLVAEYQPWQTNPVQVARDEQRYRDRVERGCPPSPPAARRKDRVRPRAQSGVPFLEILRMAASDHCGICGRVNDLWEMDIDHVVPRAQGGLNANNRVPAHRICNRKKADRLPTGCELVWLAAVNAGIAHPSPIQTSRLNEGEGYE